MKRIKDIEAEFDEICDGLGFGISYEYDPRERDEGLIQVKTFLRTTLSEALNSVVPEGKPEEDYYGDFTDRESGNEDDAFYSGLSDGNALGFNAALQEMKDNITKFLE